MIQPNINNYQESFKEKILILNPDTKQFVQLEDWKKVEDPTRSGVVAIDTPYYRIAINKTFLGERMSFEEAQEMAASICILGQPCRCPRRNECNYIYDARFNGLDEALKLIGGDSIDNKSWWTCEADADPFFWSASRYIANGFWYFYGINGYANNSSLNLSYRCLPVVLLPVSGSEL